MKIRSLFCFCTSVVGLVTTICIHIMFFEYPWYAFRSTHAPKKSMHLMSERIPISKSHSLQSFNIKSSDSISPALKYFHTKSNAMNLIFNFKKNTSTELKSSQSIESTELIPANSSSQQANSTKSASRQFIPAQPNSLKFNLVTPSSSNIDFSGFSSTNFHMFGSRKHPNQSSTLSKNGSNGSFIDKKIRGARNGVEKKEEAVRLSILDDEENFFVKKKKRRIKECQEIRNLNTMRYSSAQEPPHDKGKYLSNLPRIEVLKSSIAVKTLAKILEKRLEIINASAEKMHDRRKSWHRTCNDRVTLANSCDKVRGCLQTQLPQDAATKIQQLIDRSNLRLQPNQVKQLQKMADEVDDIYDIIFISAASSNHYFESQALLQSLHTKVFPFFKNFAFLVYDLGFTSEQRATFQRFCRCKVLDYDSSKFPKFASNLKKFAWKPYLIKAHAHQARVLVWMDASIRFFLNPVGLRRLLTEDVQKFGVMAGYSVPDSCFTTCRSTYHSFGDEPCAYLGLPIFQASILIFHNDPLVQRVILEPWTACAFDQNCIAPLEVDCIRAGCATALKNYNSYRYSKGAFKYGLCHHYDQAVITLILHKLYLEYSPLLRIGKNNTIIICRGDYYDYFSTLQ